MAQTVSRSVALHYARRGSAIRREPSAICASSHRSDVDHPVFLFPLADVARRQSETVPRRNGNGAGNPSIELILRAVRSLAHALEAKDAYTWGHSKRVATYSVAIARELGLTEQDQAMLALGGELHDVGKIGVREDILRKPGPLTAQEYDHVMQHTVIGARILSPLLPSDSPVLHIVRWHHERIDAATLACQLGSAMIPLEARIVAVADAFDAMTSERPYRPALSLPAAVRELHRNAGSQFDADCVQACLSAVTGGRLAALTA